MTDILTILLKITVVIFMAGNLLELGLRLDLKAALGGLRDIRFVTLSFLWAFVLCPALAWGLTRVIPLSEPYATGLILLGLTPCAPLLPMVADRARGDPNYAATFMLLASAGTVVQMPFAVPLLVQGLTVSAWTIAKPLLVLVVIPLVIGMGVQILWPSVAARIQPFVKKGTGIDTVLMLILVVIIYGKGFLGSIGSYAIGTQAVFFLLITATSYALGFGMPPRQKSVMSLGLCTRNCGAALAPLFVAADVDRSAIVMVSLGIPMMFISAIIAARIFAGRSDQPVSPEIQELKRRSPADSRPANRTAGRADTSEELP
ncbi:bile acid:sodium symporter family protein [Rhizobium leguminosarum]|uniref:Sodium Bile acid symporter family protein n=1 Tax=Rhizobium leguminosarum TaxID=384 RepID=A0A2Z4YUW1_RHILE|nr:bile acid:sodium symporter [Rhizobium leguminosarum]AXA44275.1 Sodium Bile acid symporter family protein [Rhizobium leguminosarum]